MYRLLWHYLLSDDVATGLVYPDRVDVKSVPVDLPDVVAESEAVNPDNNLYLLGRDRDLTSASQEVTSNQWPVAS